MKTRVFRIVLAVALIAFVSASTAEAQTKTEQKLKEIKERRAIAGEMKGLLTEERKANVGEDPCTIFDDDEWFTAFSQKEGRRGDAKLAASLLQANQQQLKAKIRGHYRGLIQDYSQQIEADAASSVLMKVEEAGATVIDQMIEDTQEYCRKTSEPDNAGNIIMYMSIRIKKSVLTDKIAKTLSEDKEMSLRFKEDQFRKSAFKNFEQDNQSE